MKDTNYLHELDQLKQEQVEKANSLQERYENGSLSKESYETQMNGVERTVDNLGKQIEEEIKNQGLSEQEYLEAKEEWREQDQEQCRR